MDEGLNMKRSTIMRVTPGAYSIRDGLMDKISEGEDMGDRTIDEMLDYFINKKSWDAAKSRIANDARREMSGSYAITVTKHSDPEMNYGKTHACTNDCTSTKMDTKTSLFLKDWMVLGRTGSGAEYYLLDVKVNKNHEGGLEE